MNETRSQQEPSMEEILASIRRIISEDGLGSRASFDAQNAEEAPTGFASPKSRDGTPGPQKTESTENKDADILLLTEMLAEDGSVVSLTPSADLSRPASLPNSEDRAPASAESALADAPRPAGLPSLRAESDDTRRADSDDMTSEWSVPSTETGSALPPQATAPAPQAPALAESEVPEAPLAEFEPSAPDLAESDAPESNPAERNEIEPEMPSEEAEPARPEPVMALPESVDHQMENEAVSIEVGKKPDLVSKEAETASTAALADLARTVARERENAIAGGRMVEDLVREALQPMLKQWLDNNLPGLVERLVRDEIQRLARRAEDSA